jgi:hypothetical protein
MTISSDERYRAEAKTCGHSTQSFQVFSGLARYLLHNSLLIQCSSHRPLCIGSMILEELVREIKIAHARLLESEPCFLRPECAESTGACLFGDFAQALIVDRCAQV